ncbi:bifunctional diaminohydroxyphosphoribosylaminopyrimidine deaminase/5-amino-6-(5-phosphoribosylamino)uracil reductase RibD [Spirosoma sp. HMF4905]|uniref:Riboflavin biosynthesis protein RibD n=1 Tax=Spirosoma arboris TaxID=2682092 RepID=A0A7K1S4R5_9BACT|nr:bifunctional diaminohydroxyphosphoribosylaminopyrimidine deaminase/5-amino-6-(5-phosphoribosylamino)uracil reductase RibD [Spirosoma arboris]MVM28725.1 bifunctional diaminohydroxyphosphoribosylaminopyrimidine deaminase/5-amino-6-(5-phosphoribosylamino)uracil reductase RibD [Spirosoma arboris]
MNQFMRRALELATLGRGYVSPNPMVGCVIVHDPEGTEPRIIGEGWHQRYGEAHAERNAIASVRPEDLPLLPQSTAYVTLEPCSHYGKQPPCADLLIEKQIGCVVCCNDDPNPLVSGQGFAKLRAAGITVETGFLSEIGRELNARFFTFFEQSRPYIMLKWAETSDGFIGAEGGQPVKISGDLANRLVHRWRSEEDAIMVGTNTARMDNPRLNTRLWPGKNPTRIVIDKNLSLPADLNLFDGTQSTIVYHESEGEIVEERPNVIHSITPRNAGPILIHLLNDLHERKIQSVLVEGGAKLLQSFIEAGLWDEMRVFRSRMMLGKGRFAGAIKAPAVQGSLSSREMIGEDELTIYKNSPENESGAI